MTVRALAADRLTVKLKVALLPPATSATCGLSMDSVRVSSSIRVSAMADGDTLRPPPAAPETVSVSSPSSSLSSTGLKSKVSLAEIAPAGMSILKGATAA